MQEILNISIYLLGRVLLTSRFDVTQVDDCLFRLTRQSTWVLTINSWSVILLLQVQRHEPEGDCQHWDTISKILSYHLFMSEVVTSGRLRLRLHIETCQTFGKVILVLKWKRRFEWKSSRNSRDLVLTTWTSTLLSKHRHYLATGCSLKCDTIKIKLQFSQVHRLPPPPSTHPQAG